MKTLQEDIDDLDRMVDTNAAKDAIRSQIRLIAREVATLEADYTSLAQSHAELEATRAKEKAEAEERRRNVNNSQQHDAPKIRASVFE